MDGGISLLQELVAHDDTDTPVVLPPELFGGRRQLRRAQIGRRRVDEIANQKRRLGRGSDSFSIAGLGPGEASELFLRALTQAVEPIASQRETESSRVGIFLGEPAP